MMPRVWSLQSSDDNKKKDVIVCNSKDKYLIAEDEC